MHVAHLAQGELVLILLDEGHDHVLDELSLHLSKLHLTAYCAAMHLDRSCDHPCDNELRLLCAAQQFVELLGDHHHGTNGRSLDDHDLPEDGRYSDDHDPLEDDLLNHHDHTTDDHRDHRDQPTDGHYLDDHDPPEDDLLNLHGYKTNDHHDHRDLPTDDRDLLVDDRDLGHHFARMQDDLLDDYLDGLDVRHDLMPRGRDYLLDDQDCPTDDPGLRLVCLNDRLHHQHRRDGRDAMVCRILLPVADDVDRDFQGLALDEVYLQTMSKHRTYARWY
jgi:hypothetical protein